MATERTLDLPKRPTFGRDIMQTMQYTGSAATVLPKGNYTKWTAPIDSSYLKTPSAYFFRLSTLQGRALQQSGGGTVRVGMTNRGFKPSQADQS